MLTFACLLLNRCLFSSQPVYSLRAAFSSALLSAPETLGPASPIIYLHMNLWPHFQYPSAIVQIMKYNVCVSFCLSWLCLAPSAWAGLSAPDAYIPNQHDSIGYGLVFNWWYPRRISGACAIRYLHKTHASRMSLMDWKRFGRDLPPANRCKPIIALYSELDLDGSIYF